MVPGLLDRVFEVGVIGECLVERIQIEAIVIQEATPLVSAAKNRGSRSSGLVGSDVVAGAGSTSSAFIGLV
jgi:hypothetical protein